MASIHYHCRECRKRWTVPVPATEPVTNDWKVDVIHGSPLHADLDQMDPDATD